MTVFEIEAQDLIEFHEATCNLEKLHDAVFSVLHTPPSASGFNRTTWKLTDLAKDLESEWNNYYPEQYQRGNQACWVQMEKSQSYPHEHGSCLWRKGRSYSIGTYEVAAGRGDPFRSMNSVPSL